MKTAFLIMGSLLIISCSNRAMITERTSRVISPFMVQTVLDDGGLFHKTIMMYNALSPKELFDAEYRYISDLFGERGRDWFLMNQTLVEENDRIVDVVEIKGKRAFEQKVIFFDVTDVFSDKDSAAVCLTAKHD